MIIWGGYDGGYLNAGGIYDPTTDTWKATSTTNAPTPRLGHTAVWTGSRMIIWGGCDVSCRGGGGIYDPTTDTWTGMSTANAPSTYDHTAVWTGSGMFVWGGGGGGGNSGGIYEPTTDTWTSTSTTSAPTGRRDHKAVWTGASMIAWGGRVSSGGLSWLDTGGTYDPTTDTWKATSTANAPTPREGHTAVWTGSKMIVWGGFDGGYLNTGGIYDPATDTWTATSTLNAPSAGAAVWTGSKMIVWGGYGGGYLNTGRLYSNPAVLPPPPAPADFFTVTPCRLVDTRNAAGPTGGPSLSPGATRNFPVTGGACGIPSTATAVALSVTVTQPAAEGYLSLYPGDAAGPPLVSSINFTPGVTRANNAVVPLATNGGTINVNNASAGAVHFVLDVSGYFQ